MTLFANRRFRPAALAACACLTLLPSIAWCQDTAIKTFSIPAEDLGTALTHAAQQGGREIMFAAELTRGKATDGVQGQMTLDQALAVLLAGRGLTYRVTDSGAIIIEKAPSTKGDAAPATGPHAVKPVSSDDAPADTANTAAADPDAVTIQTMVVTAQKRPQTLLDVPTSIVALSGEQVRERGITDFVTLAQSTPGVIAANQATGGRTSQTFTIRGIGDDDFRANGNPSAAVHFDGVYMGSAALIGGQLFDVERIEVLKGPQGTLYGRNTTAGAINVISRKPGDKFEGRASVDVGNYGSVRTEAAYGGPIDERWGVRIAGVYDRSDGYLTNTGAGNFAGITPKPGVIPPNSAVKPSDDATGTEFAGARSLITFRPEAGTDLSLSVHGFHENGGTAQTERVIATSKYAADAPYTFSSNVVPYLHKNSNGMSLTVDQELPRDLLLTVIADYENLAQQFMWNDGTPIRTFDIDYYDHVEQRSLEARVRNNDGEASRTDWVLGSIYYEDKVGLRSTLDSSDYLRTFFATDYRQTRNSWAVFGDLTNRFAERWSAGVGLRYTNERSTFAGSTVDLNPYGLTLGPRAFPTLPVIFDQSFQDDRVSGKATLTYRPNDNTTLYTSIGQGFKAGGFDGSTITAVQEAEPFKSETVTAYEAGLKYLPNGPVQVDASVFYYDYKDMQANSTRIIATTPTNVRTNVGRSHILGAELNLLARPMRNLDLNLGLSVLNTRITEANSDDAAESARRIGNQLPNSPKLTANVGARHTQALGGDTVMVSTINGRWIGKYYGELDNYQTIGDYFIGDARLEFRFGKRWSLAAWVKNFTDRAYFAGFGGVSATSANLYRGAPRTFGVNAQMRF